MEQLVTLHCASGHQQCGTLASSAVLQTAQARLAKGTSIKCVFCPFNSHDTANNVAGQTSEAWVATVKNIEGSHREVGHVLMQFPTEPGPCMNNTPTVLRFNQIKHIITESASSLLVTFQLLRAWSNSVAYSLSALQHTKAAA